MGAKRKENPELIDDENPEWTAQDFARARPAAEVMGAEFMANWAKGGPTIKQVSDAQYEATKRKIGERGPQRTPLKERITIRLSPDVLTRFRASGTGWQGRIDAALREWLKRHSPD